MSISAEERTLIVQEVIAVLSRKQGAEGWLCTHNQLEGMEGGALSNNRNEEVVCKEKCNRFLRYGTKFGRRTCTHLYQAADIGYVWRGVTHSLILLHLERKAQIHPSQGIWGQDSAQEGWEKWV